MVARVIWFLVCTIGSARLGGLAFAFIGLPLGMLALWTNRSLEDVRYAAMRLTFSTLLSLALVVLAVYEGTPANMVSWFVVMGVVTWTIVLCLIIPSRGSLAALLPSMVGVAAFVTIADVLPTRGYHCADLRNGRKGVALSEPVMMMTNGPNENLIADKIGVGQADWFYRCTGDGRITLEMPDTRSLVFSKQLPVLLEFLPNSAARRQILTNLTNKNNLIRVHQGLLLTCLYEYGYPDDYTKDEWWETYGHLFEAKHDVHDAVAFSLGITEMAEALNEDTPRRSVERQLLAARYFERGMYTRCPDFGRVYMEETMRGTSPTTELWW